MLDENVLKYASNIMNGRIYIAIAVGQLEILNKFGTTKEEFSVAKDRKLKPTTFLPRKWGAGGL